MNREIKFRVWDKKYKVMDEIDGNNLYFADGKIYDINITYQDKEDVTNDYELMQYIGLKDKNGKGIYEGDIVRVYKEVDNLIFTGKVIFKDASFAVQNDFFTGYCWQDYEVEVIGNIFEENDLWKYE